MGSGQGFVAMTLGLAFARFKALQIDASVFDNPIQQPLSAFHRTGGLRCFAEFPDCSGEGEEGSDEGGWQVEKECVVER